MSEIKKRLQTFYKERVIALFPVGSRLVSGM